MAKDPVCGMTVDEKTAKFKSDYMGKTYYFCAASCKTTFDKNPVKFAGGKSGHSSGCGCGCGGHC
jgi:YHS domain-containing protein